MHRQGVLVAGLLTAALVLYPLAALSNLGGALPSRTGAPLPGGGFELTCGNGTTCHNDFAVDSGPGRLTIDGPDHYGPGAVLDLTLRVEQNDKVLFGFEMTVKDADSEHVGTLELIDPTTTKFATATNTNYVTHSRQGNLQNAWTVRWIAPDQDVGPVTVYAAGNAADGGGTRTGDHVYTASKTLTFATGTAVEETPARRAFTLERAYPNPFSGQTTVGYTLRRAAPVTLALYDALGRRVRLLDLGTQAAGPHQVRLDAEGLPAGLYLYELRTPDAREARPLMRLK